MPTPTDKTEKRVAKRPATPATAAKAPTTTAPAVRTLTDEQLATRLEDLTSKAQRGDAHAWRALRPILDKIPNWEQGYESPAERARHTRLEATVGSNPGVVEAWLLRARTMAHELAGPDASLLERTLCDRVATCSLDLSLTEIVYASRTQDGMSLEAGEYYQKAKDRAHRRYLTACLALAKVRRLLAPVAQQVNIAQPGASQLNITHSAQPAAAAAALPDAPATVDADGPAERY